MIKKLALETCRDVLIGDTMAKGISGGQAKRTNIGIALITNPRVIFLDEPTSGLDSYTANEVMTVVKALLEDGTTICATIHSPSQARRGRRGPRHRMGGGLGAEEGVRSPSPSSSLCIL